MTGKEKLEESFSNKISKKSYIQTPLYRIGKGLHEKDSSVHIS